MTSGTPHGSRNDGIANDLIALHHHRYLWRRVGEITHEADLPPSTFFDALGAWYGRSQMVAIRRLVDRDPRSLSIRRLLDDVLEHPDVIDRDRHIALSLRNPEDEWSERDGERSYEHFADASGAQLDVEAVEADRDRAVTAAATIKTYVDQRIAHRDLEPVTDVPTWGEINAAIDTFAELVNKYALLFKASSYLTFEPVIQHDWEAPSGARGWLKSDGRLLRHRSDALAHVPARRFARGLRAAGGRGALR